MRAPFPGCGWGRRSAALLWRAPSLPDALPRLGGRVEWVLGNAVILGIGDARRGCRPVRNRGQLAHHRFPRPRLPGKMPRARAIFVHRFTLKGSARWRTTAFWGSLRLMFCACCLRPVPRLRRAHRYNQPARDHRRWCESGRVCESCVLLSAYTSAEVPSVVKPLYVQPQRLQRPVGVQNDIAAPFLLGERPLAAGFCSPPAPASARCAS